MKDSGAMNCDDGFTVVQGKPKTLPKPPQYILKKEEEKLMKDVPDYEKPYKLLMYDEFKAQVKGMTVNKSFLHAHFDDDEDVWLKIMCPRGKACMCSRDSKAKWLSQRSLENGMKQLTTDERNRRCNGVRKEPSHIEDRNTETKLYYLDGWGQPLITPAGGSVCTLDIRTIWMVVEQRREAYEKKSSFSFRAT